MQVSVETTSTIERRMTIGVPAEKVESEVEQRLQQTSSTIRLNGFRPGKVPAKVIKKRFGKSVRQEVIGEVMRDSYIEAITKEGFSPVGYPKFEPKTLEEGKDLEFVAVFEVYPEIELADLSKLSVEKISAEIGDADINEMLDVLSRQHGTLKPVKRKSKKKDTLTIDFKGFVGDEAFEGGSAEDQKLVLGSGQMIPGFEDGLVGAKAGEDVELNVTFPEDYQNQELAGKAARFEVTVKEVEETILPELNEEFYAKFGVKASTEEEFKAEIVKNMERELAQAISNKLKLQVVDGLLEHHQLEVPSTLVEEEINKMKQDAIQQFGGGQQFDASKLPSEMFKDQAESRVKTGMLFAAVAKDFDIKADSALVDAKIQEIANTYEDPAEVVAWYSKPENKVQIESAVLEDAIVEHVVSKAKVKVKKASYTDAVKPAERKPVKKDESGPEKAE